MAPTAHAESVRLRPESAEGKRWRPSEATRRQAGWEWSRNTAASSCSSARCSSVSDLVRSGACVAAKLRKLLTTATKAGGAFSRTEMRTGSGLLACHSRSTRWCRPMARATEFGSGGAGRTEEGMAYNTTSDGAPSPAGLSPPDSRTTARPMADGLYQKPPQASRWEQKEPTGGLLPARKILSEGLYAAASTGVVGASKDGVTAGAGTFSMMLRSSLLSTL